LDGVFDADPEAFTVSEVAADRLREERDGDDDLLEAVLPEELDDVLHAGLADDRHHRLRLVRGQRSQPRSLPTCHDNCPHAPGPLRLPRGKSTGEGQPSPADFDPVVTRRRVAPPMPRCSPAPCWYAL